MLADPGFLAKLAVEAGMGVLTKLAAELRKRPDKFWQELDLVSANTIMSLISDVMLIWIPAPRIVLHSPAAVEKHHPNSQLSRAYNFWATCPANAFQVNSWFTAGLSCKLSTAGHTSSKYNWMENQDWYCMALA